MSDYDGGALVTDDLLSIEDWQARYIVYCPKCREKTMPSDFGVCYFCDTQIVSQRGSFTHFRCGHPKKKNTYYTEDGHTECLLCREAA